jgi:uncharacterized membrane protein YuzA (DUF378 family)
MEESKSTQIKMKKIYNKTKFRMVLTALVIVGGLNWGATALGYNLVEILSKTINSYFNSDYPIDKVIYIIVALAAIMLAMRRTTWLPFLGRTVLPGSLLELKTPKDANKKIKIKTKPNTKIAYWAATGKDSEQGVWDAYGEYPNAGVVMSNEKGEAELSIVEGAGYVVPTGKTIARHVHYRVVGPYGMLGKVKTQFYYSGDYFK